VGADLIADGTWYCVKKGLLDDWLSPLFVHDPRLEEAIPI
jgi:hypothetical protein